MSLAKTPIGRHLDPRNWQTRTPNAHHVLLFALVRNRSDNRHVRFAQRMGPSNALDVARDAHSHWCLRVPRTGASRSLLYLLS
jgi:hypothetical protein